MRTNELMAQAETLANDLLQYAQENQIGAHELIMIATTANRLLQSVCFPGSKGSALDAVMEAHATFEAVSSPLETN